MKIRDIMNINATRIQVGTTLRHAAEQFIFTGASDLVAVDAEGNFVGVLSEGDVMRAALPQLTEVLEAGGSLSDAYDLFQEKGRTLADQPIDTYIIRNPITLSPNDDVQKAATIMATKQIRRLPVVESGRLAGTVSRADVCRAVFR